MADFVAVLRKTIDALENNTPETREKVFEKARAAIERRLASMDPAPPPIAADRQRRALEDAISAVRTEYDGPAEDTFDDLEQAFAAEDEDPPPPPPAAEPLVPPNGESAAPGARDEPVLAGSEPSPEVALPPPPEEAGPAAMDPAAPEPAGPVGATATEAPAASRSRASGATGRRTGLVAAVLALIVVAGAGYAVLLNAHDFAELLGAAGPAQISGKENGKPDPQ
jgi:hypothetical protein